MEISAARVLEGIFGGCRDVSELERLARVNGEPRVSIRCFGHVEPMPVDDGFLGEMVAKMNPYSLTCARADDGAKVAILEGLKARWISGQHLTLVGKDVRRLTGEHHPE